MKNENILAIGTGLTVLALLFRKEKVVPGGGVPQTQGAQSAKPGEAAVGKIYDSYGQRSGGRVDDYWGDIVPSRSYLGRDADLRGYYLDPQKAIEHFNLYGIEFGNWMNQSDRVNFMYATLVSLADMAKVLGVAQAKMGLNQKLQLAFGARGQGGYVRAFYERVPVALINLTKTMGRGTFAHEFGHAIDEHVRLVTKKERGLLSGRSTNRQTNPGLYPKESIEYLFEQVFHTLYWKEDGTPTKFYKDQSERSEYYNRRSEVWARTFEKYIEIKFQAAGIVNRWAIEPSPEQPPKDLVLKAQPWIRRIINRAF